MDGSLDSLDLKTVLRVFQQVPASSALSRRAREILEGSLEVKPPGPKATLRKEQKFLTIGMASATDYDGVYFTIQAIRLYHPEVTKDVEFLIVDNDPAGPCAQALRRLGDSGGNCRYIPYRTVQGTWVRDLIFREATGEFVLCVDSHVLLAPGSLARLIEYCRQHSGSNDLLHGPLLSDTAEPVATHYEAKWATGFYGCWEMDNRAQQVDAPPFEIGMTGLGVFACRREAWPGFNSRMAGFGGEEGYIHEKVRRAGGRNLCLPFLRWTHRYERPLGVPYRCDWRDRVRNYLLAHAELSLDPAPVIGHFEEYLGRNVAQPLIAAVQAELTGPFHFLDAVYCVNLDRHPERWEAMLRGFRALGIERLVRRFSAADTPLNLHIGRALSHRRIIAEAKLQRLKTVLVFEDEDFMGDLVGEDDDGDLAIALRELEACAWQIAFPGGSAIAYHHTVYDAILSSVPDDAFEVERLVRPLDQASGDTMRQLLRMAGALENGSASRPIVGS